MGLTYSTRHHLIISIFFLYFDWYNIEATNPTKTSQTLSGSILFTLHSLHESGTALHCTSLFCTALHSTKLHFIALTCTALHCTTMHCTALHCTALHYTALHCTTMHCTPIRYIKVHWTM